MSGLAGRYMTFRLGGEEYGVPILAVRELLGLCDLTRVPGTRPFVRGIMNLRGRVVPVIDLRLKFGMPELCPTDQTVIMVVQLPSPQGELTFGVLLDEVLEVLRLDDAQIAPPPQLTQAGALDAEFITGVGKTAKKVVFLLDIVRVLSAEERAQLNQAS